MADEAMETTGKETSPQDSKGNDDKGQPDPLKKLSDEIFTRIGRLDAEHRKHNEAILARLESITESRQGKDHGTENASPQQKALNEKWAERILNGDVASVLDEALNLREQSVRMLSQRAQSQMDNLLGAMEQKEVPFFKEVSATVKDEAAKLISKNYSPEDAVAFAYEKARADHLQSLYLGNGANGGNLETLGGGSRREDSGEKKGKLPPNLKKAYERDKAYFKDEADYINTLSPQIRQQYGI